MSRLCVKRSEPKNLINWILKNEKEDHSLHVSARGMRELSSMRPLDQVIALRSFIREHGYHVDSIKLSEVARVK